jgi:hypothetical protein
MRIPGIMPDIWSILHREQQAQVKIVKTVKQKKYKLDGRMTRWIPYYFKKFYKPKGWWYYFKKAF